MGIVVANEMTTKEAHRRCLLQPTAAVEWLERSEEILPWGKTIPSIPAQSSIPLPGVEDTDPPHGHNPIPRVHEPHHTAYQSSMLAPSVYLEYGHEYNRAPHATGHEPFTGCQYTCKAAGLQRQVDALNHRLKEAESQNRLLELQLRQSYSQATDEAKGEDPGASTTSQGAVVRSRQKT
jgi:hypothetical protein